MKLWLGQYSILNYIENQSNFLGDFRQTEIQKKYFELNLKNWVRLVLRAQNSKE